MKKAAFPKVFCFNTSSRSISEYLWSLSPKFSINKSLKVSYPNVWSVPSVFRDNPHFFDGPLSLWIMKEHLFSSKENEFGWSWKNNSHWTIISTIKVVILLFFMCEYTVWWKKCWDILDYGWDKFWSVVSFRIQNRIVWTYGQVRIFRIIS